MIPTYHGDSSGRNPTEGRGAFQRIVLFIPIEVSISSLAARPSQNYTHCAQATLDFNEPELGYL